MRRLPRFSVVLISWLILILAILFLYLFYLFKIRASVNDFAVSNAKTALQQYANKAVIEVLSSEDTNYYDISHISKNSDNEITGIEIDGKNSNILKSKILLKIDDYIPKQEVYTVKIPLGTLLFNSFFGGAGPKITFHSQISSGCNVDFNSSFESVGINETRHRIFLDVHMSGVILILGNQTSYSVNTSFIVAETIISGHTPNSFANISRANTE